MDFIRAAIKGLFYLYPVERVAECITRSDDTSFIFGLKEVLRWDNPQFTTTEIGILENVISQMWMKPFRRSFPVDGIPMPGRALFVLFHFGNDVFDTGSWSRPVLNYDHLLRWRDIAYLVGEDIMTIPFLADQDSVRRYDRSSFVWENVVRHNNKALNRILDGGLVEVHSHINAATDVFELNWIRLMNGVGRSMTGRSVGQKQKYALNDYRQDFSPAFWDSVGDMTLYDWGIVAAAIRTILYKVCIKGERVDPEDLSLLRGIIREKTQLYEIEEQIIETIGSFERDSFRLRNERVFDYAITESSAKRCSLEELRNPFFAHQGERELLYGFFKMAAENVSSVFPLAPYVYLYILIKNKYRREFVQTNPLSGFENFQRYQKRKSLYLDNEAINKSVNFKYAVQTSLGDIEGDMLETRIAPEQAKKRQREEFKRSIFEEGDYYQHEIKENDLTIVVHFIKKPDSSKGEHEFRHASYRAYLQNQMRLVVSLCKDSPMDSDVKKIKIVGIDAAGAELDCRPEVFAPSFRYAQLCGLNNITYHAGEDFYDLLDGMRTIDEVMIFMNYHRGCRIGHALALGINPSKYYARRHHNTILPRQVMLDNLVWLFYKARQLNVELRPATLDLIDQQAHVLYQQIGYDGEFDRFSYWQSMLLRGDDPDANETELQELTPRERAARCHHPSCDSARVIAKARLLWLQYNTDINVKENGNMPCSFVLPDSIALDVEELQEKMMDEIERKGIYIECNPTSNLMIGPFDRYDELPLWRFHNVGSNKRHSINVSINTDDKGVFATSLYNEYSLISLAMLKKKDEKGEPVWTPKEVIDYIKELVEMSHSQKFDPVNVCLTE